MSILTEEEIALLSSRSEGLSVDSLPSINKEDNFNYTMDFKRKYLNCTPMFNGNSTELQQFIHACESIIIFYDAANPASVVFVHLQQTRLLISFKEQCVL